MSDGAPPDVERCLTAIVQNFPELNDARPQIFDTGLDCLAVALGSWLFKFPRHAAAEKALRREGRILAVLGHCVDLPTPKPILHEGPPIFSRHRTIPGVHLLTPTYNALEVGARDTISRQMAAFHRDLHAIPRAVMTEAGAGPIMAWLPPRDVAMLALPRLSSNLRDAARETLNAAEALGPDPLSEVFGMFDGHGWNMAFNAEAKRLNGIYDFGDAGFGPLHREFVYSSFVSPDLTARIVDHYEAITDVTLDRERIAVLTVWHRMWELAVCPAQEVSAMRANVAQVLMP